MPRSRCSPARCTAPGARRTCSARAPGTGTRAGTTPRTSRTPYILLDRWLRYPAVAMSFFRSLPLHCCFHISVALEPALTLAIVEQLVVKLGMGNLDERLGPLTHRLAVQVGDAMFGDNIVNVSPRSQNARTVRQARYNTRHGFVLGRRWQRDDRLAPLGARRPADEVQLPTKAAVEVRPNRLGTHLPGQVNFDCGVDGHHTMVLRDTERVVGVGRGMKLEDRVFVDEIEELLSAQHEAENDLARLEVLALTVDHTRLDQRNGAVGDQLGVHSQVLAVHQAKQDRVGDGANPTLQDRA